MGVVVGELLGRQLASEEASLGDAEGAGLAAEAVVVGAVAHQGKAGFGLAQGDVFGKEPQEARDTFYAAVATDAEQALAAHGARVKGVVARALVE